MADRAVKTTTLRLVDETSECAAHHGLPHASKLVQLENEGFLRACIYCGALSEPRFGDKIRDEVPTEVFVERDDIHDRVRVLEIRHRPSETEDKPGEEIYRLVRIRNDFKFEMTGRDFHYKYSEAPEWKLDPLVLGKLALGEGVIILILVAILLGVLVF